MSRFVIDRRHYLLARCVRAGKSSLKATCVFGGAMRRLLAVLTAIATLGLMPAAAGDTVVDEQASFSFPPIPGDVGWISGYYDDAVEDIRGTSVMFGITRSSFSGFWSDAAVCRSMDDPACDRFDTFEFETFLGPCTENLQTNCIAGFRALRGSVTQDATFEREFPEQGKTDFLGNDSLGIPDAQSPSLWRFPDLTHSGGSDFMLAAALTGQARSSGPVSDTQLKVGLYPVSVLSTPGRESAPWIVSQRQDNTYSRGMDNSTRHLFQGSGEALVRWPFPADTRFQITVRTKQAVTGWLHGRVQEPEISVRAGAFGQEYSVTAAPAIVPTVDHWSRFRDLPEPLRIMLRQEPPGGVFFGERQTSESDWEKVTVSYQNSGRATEGTLQKFLYFVEAANDRAAANKSSWVLRTIGSDELQEASSCLRSTDTLAGVVATNATVYLAGPPRFDTATQTLNYRVAAPHYARDGKANIGHYSLVMRSEVARCVYGFRNAPISASISVISADGSPQVATTVVSQKDGWLNLVAGGFTYSSPTVQVKLTQQAPSAEVATPGTRPPVGVRPATPRTTITCVKGSQVTRVRAAKPRCPVGWRRR